MDAPEPDQTPFNAVQAQTSKIARVRYIKENRTNEKTHD
jgi:hypothetical protein